jgi:hypothetical protein
MSTGFHWNINHLCIILKVNIVYFMMKKWGIKENQSSWLILNHKLSFNPNS